MEIAKNITLATAIFWFLWQILSVRDAAINSKGIFPAIIPSSILFGISIVVILIFHLSPFHLLWLAVICFVCGFIAIISPPVQGLSMGFLVLLSMTGANKIDGNDNIDSEPPVFSAKSQPKKAKAKKQKRGFG